MNKKEKEILVKLLGAVGLIVLLVGLFAQIYEFKYGLATAIVIWILTGVLKAYFGIKEEKEKKGDLNGLLIGGMILFFIGLALLCSAYFVMKEAGVYIGGFITSGIGMALLASYFILKRKK
ncbi:MAG: hypothetical protein V1802_01915 [Candidatus Aenigmatarchaeota archaeon]